MAREKSDSLSKDTYNCVCVCVDELNIIRETLKDAVSGSEKRYSSYCTAVSKLADCAVMEYSTTVLQE